MWWPPGGTGLARLGVFEEPKKAGMSGAGERAAGSEAERGTGHTPWSLPQVHQEAMGRFLAGEHHILLYISK